MKKVAVIICILIMLCGCSVDMSSGNGAPIPKDDTASEWASTESAVSVEITWDEASPVLYEFTDLFDKIANSNLYQSDITYMKSVADYLAQYKSYESDLAVYMHSIELLCKTYYDLFARNIDRAKAQKQVDAYINTYYGLSDGFKASAKPIENTNLYAVLDMTDALAAQLTASVSPQ